MFTTYWSVKGGSGATVMAAGHALCLSRSAEVVLVDLDGDLPATLGLPATGPGCAEWLRAGADVPPDALERLLVPIRPGASLLPRGEGPLDPARADVLADLLASSSRHVVADCGTRPDAAAAAVVRASDRSVLTTRACYLGVQRAVGFGLAATEIALVREQNRALRSDDIAEALGVPVRTVVPVDPTIARAVDAGLLASRMPRALERALAKGGAL